MIFGFMTIKKLFKYIAYFLLSVVLIVNLFIVLSGRYYLYSGIAKTYLIGKMGPGIYDLDVFPVNKISKSTSPKKLQVRQPNISLTSQEESYLNAIDTRAFLIFQDDTLLHEQYWGPHAINEVSNSFSASKTVIGLLIGIAIEEGKIPSVDEPVSTFIPEFETNGRAHLTIRHLLTMSAGFDWQESGKNPLSEAAEIKLWQPLEMCENATWSSDRNNMEKAFCCITASAQDYAKFGRLYLNKGKWNGKTIFSEEWFDKSIRRDSTNGSSFNFNYSWHIGLKKYEDFMAIGLYKQHIYIYPEKNVIIVLLNDREKKLIAERVNWW
ncbi:serine hydrolase, partial [Crocinitomicaceae bacterium]|nr:serine hydrolase [Crocinitomicaceae bacterium]